VNDFDYHNKYILDIINILSAKTMCVCSFHGVVVVDDRRLVEIPFLHALHILLHACSTDSAARLLARVRTKRTRDERMQGN
jgi:hypothetical protein